MFGTSPIETMRQDERESGLPHPLVLAIGEESIDDHLSSVKKITELGFPADKVEGIVDRIPVLE